MYQFILMSQIYLITFQYFRTLANHHQVAVNSLLIELGLPLELGRRVDDTGDCYFDALLAQLQDPRIKATIHPMFREITTIQGPYYIQTLFSSLNEKSVSLIV